MQEMNTYMHTLYVKTEWKSKEIILGNKCKKIFEHQILWIVMFSKAYELKK